VATATLLLGTAFLGAGLETLLDRYAGHEGWLPRDTEISRRAVRQALADDVARLGETLAE
jgi:hypothetical protein